MAFVVGSQSSLRRLGSACSQPSRATHRGDSLAFVVDSQSSLRRLGSACSQPSRASDRVVL